jgi:hypothetical protein
MPAVFDVETDGLLEEATKVHCLSYTQDGENYHTLFKDKEIKEWIESQKVLIGHDIVRYDIPVVERILDVDIKAKLYDTLPISWVINVDRPSHGLDSFGEDFGIPKPKIDDWENLTPEEYAHRCTEDVKINWCLWQDLIKRFKFVYGKDKVNMDRFFQYLTFKMKCAATAEQVKWKLDVDLAQKSHDDLEKQQEEKVELLKQHMPMVPKYKMQNPPKSIYKKDGTPSAAGQRWLDTLMENQLPSDHNSPVKVLSGMEAPNPNSVPQVKDWLFSLGWEPCTFKYDKDSDGKEKKIPQVRYSEPGHPKKGELTESVKLLIDKDEGVGILDGLTVIQHRKVIFKGYLENVDEDGYVKAEISGLTNTLRFKHKSPLVNLPGVDKPWGKEVRGCLTSPDGHTLCGSDMASLESTTKRHFIYPYDQEYVEEMSVDGFDEHLDLATKAGYITSDDYRFYTQSDEDTVNDKDRFKSIKTVRKKFKPVNYSSVYGVGALKMSRTTGMSVKEAQALIDAYWERNWAVKAFADDAEVKTVGGQMWVWNPVSQFWYTLRYKKDTFSTLNQGTGAYSFDTWLGYCMIRGVLPCFQAHDELVTTLREGQESSYEEVLRWAIKKTNDKLKLNVELDIDVQFGKNYANIH